MRGNLNDCPPLTTVIWRDRKPKNCGKRPNDENLKTPNLNYRKGKVHLPTLIFKYIWDILVNWLKTLRILYFFPVSEQIQQNQKRKSWCGSKTGLVLLFTKFQNQKEKSSSHHWRMQIVTEIFSQNANWSLLTLPYIEAKKLLSFKSSRHRTQHIAPHADGLRGTSVGQERVTNP